MINFLAGKKTYILAIIVAVLNLAVASGWISSAHLDQINMVLGALGVAALRAGVSKS